MKTAFFVYRPRRLADLRRPHSLEEEKPYHVSGIVILSAIDYENFTEDLLADRAFLERARKADGCLLVKQEGKRMACWSIGKRTATPGRPIIRGNDGDRYNSDWAGCCLEKCTAL